VAVYSRERDVDPVGACVGMKGTRVQAIIRELRGEKIDIVEFSEDPIEYVMSAISPAKVQRVSIVDDAERIMEVVVEDKMLSLAIGKKGQNVRLAAKLTGWKIDIKSEEEKRKEVEAQFADFSFGEMAPGEALPSEGGAAMDALFAGLDAREANEVETPAEPAATELAEAETGSDEEAVGGEDAAVDADVVERAEATVPGDDDTSRG
jgi:transcription termination/antitermination protein NusA